MKVRAVVSLKAEHRLEYLLQVAGLARSTFFYHQARLDDPDPHAALKAAITEIFHTNRKRYGHRRIRAELSKAGWVVSKKTVWKLMRQLGLECPSRRKRKYQSYQGQTGQIADNVLDRDFAAAVPNRKWVTDVTEFRVGDAKTYLSPVLDLCGRKIVAYSIRRSPNLELTNSSLAAALATLQPGMPGPLVHSDQGFQYQHASWRKLLKDARATQSMSRKGNCYDNAVIENFFGHLKEEVFHHVHYMTLDALETALHEYIDWYNNRRISETLEGLSPVQYQAQALAA